MTIEPGLFPSTEPTDVMLDLETLGVKPFSAILSIGACALRLDDNEPVTDLFYQPITLQSCLDVGLRVDADTVEWWMKQSEDARAVFFDDGTRCPLPSALDRFTDWLNSRPLQIWGNPVAFDGGLLQNAYKACSKETPWLFRQERDYATIRRLPGAKDLEVVRIGTFHNAMHDAITQAMHLRKINVLLQLQL